VIIPDTSVFNPLKDIHVMTKPDEQFSVIMKGGEFVRNRL
jgi:hypothetical protein